MKLIESIISSTIVLIILSTILYASYEIDPLQKEQRIQQDKLEFKSGNGKVSIDLNTGIVEYNDTDLDEASLAFWNKVMEVYPWVKRRVIQEYYERRQKIIERTK